MSKELDVNINELTLEKPVDKIAGKINELISKGEFKVGDKLPSERILCKKFNVGRLLVRDAIRKLEYYGILKTVPKSGTIVVDNHDSALVGLISNSINLVKPDYRSLMEARFVLEIESAGLAAERAEPHDINALEEALDLFGAKVSNGESGLEEDLLFHVRVAEASKNDLMKYLVSFLVSHMMKYTPEYDICRAPRHLKAYNEHVVILEHIKNGDVKRCKESMRYHLSSLFDFIPEVENNNQL